jgi:phosphotransacetylase
MKNKLWLISIAVSILLIISTIFTIGETRKLKTEISDLQSEIIELQSVDKESFKITQEEIDALYQLTKTQEEDLSALTELVINQENQIKSLQE